MLLSELADARRVRFGTSGVRALVADLTPDVCRAYAHAFLDICGETPGEVLIGHDLRPSSPAIAAAIASAVRWRGFTPVNAGVLPTPALAFAAQSRGRPAIMITGSHIPFDRNGIKFYLSSGEITKAQEQQILARPARVEGDAGVALAPATSSVLDEYANRYVSAFGPGSLGGLRIGVYEHSSAARDVLHLVLQALGAETLSLGRSDDFVPIDTEAVREEDRVLARGWATAHRVDAIVTTDGDADRPLIGDEAGDWLRGDVVGILCARELEAGTVVTPVSSNTALELSGAFPETIRTRIGSPYVIAGMAEAQRKPVVGYEANGGFLLGNDVALPGGPLAALPTRDALLPILLTLRAARARGMRLSELRSTLPARHTFSDRLQNVDVERCRALTSALAKNPDGFARLCTGTGGVTSLDVTDGVRATFASGDVLHLRLSGNAPELRCYAEAADAERAAALGAEALRRVGEALAALAPGL